RWYLAPESTCLGARIVRRKQLGKFRVNARDAPRLRRRRARKGVQRERGRNLTQTGVRTSRLCPVGAGIPVASLIAKTARLWVSWLAVISQRPEGSRLKPRGVRPPHGTLVTSRSRPDSSMAKTAMVLSPRFEV